MYFGEVAERSIAADCKSAAHVATEVRTLPSPPTFIARGAVIVGRARESWWGGASPHAVCFAASDASRRAAPRVSERGRAKKWSGSERRRACPPWRRGAKKASRRGGSNSVVESQPSKLLVAGSIPVSRSNLRSRLPMVRELRLASHAKVVRRSAKREGGQAGQPPLRMTR
jgi:hypothetical protein